MLNSKLHSFYLGASIILECFSLLLLLVMTGAVSNQVDLGEVPVVSRIFNVGLLPVVDLLIYLGAFAVIMIVLFKLKIKPSFSPNFIYIARKMKQISVWQLYKIALTLSAITTVFFSVTGFVLADISILTFYGNLFSVLVHLCATLLFSFVIFLYMAVKSL